MNQESPTQMLRKREEGDNNGIKLERRFHSTVPLVARLGLEKELEVIPDNHKTQITFLIRVTLVALIVLSGATMAGKSIRNCRVT